MEIDLEISDEEYVIERAKNAFKNNPAAAKSWMITAKTLYPNNFGVQFEAYIMEKNAGHIKEAAKCFSNLINKFQQQPELWQEIEKVTAALRAESDTNDAEKQFLCEMFRHISSDVQHKLLLFTADHCEDTMEHCRLLLLLLQRFPTAISSNGPRLVETLISAEKHSTDGHSPGNAYRKLLVCDLLPLLAKEGVRVELFSKMLYKLLHKAIEFYLCCLGLSNTAAMQDTETKVEDPWGKLFSVLEFIGKQLKWDPYLINFTKNWSKESYWQKIVAYCQFKKSLIAEDKQLLFCLSIFFLHCLFEYNSSLTPDSCPGQISTSYVLVEAFIDPNLPSPNTEPKSKKRKPDTENQALMPYITVEKPELKNIQSNFMICMNCWDLLNSSENLKREFLKMNMHLNLDPLLSGFLIDYTIYKGLYDDALLFLQKTTDPFLMLQRHLRIAGILYQRKNYVSMTPSRSNGAILETPLDTTHETLFWLDKDNLPDYSSTLPEYSRLAPEEYKRKAYLPNGSVPQTNGVHYHGSPNLHPNPLHQSEFACLDPNILLVIPHLLQNNPGSLSNSLIIGGNQKHLHYLPLTRMAALQYVTKILLRCIKENMLSKSAYNELAIGHIFTLVQLDWPQEEDFIPPLLEQIQQHRSFQYHNFQNYIINVDILEEITYLWTSQGGQIQLDILPHIGQRRIGTRGADKGVKEEIKQAIRRQITRSNENIDELIINFIMNESQQILQTLI